MSFRTLLLVFLVGFLVAACSTGQLLTEANMALERGDYYDAVLKYKEVNEKEKDPKVKAEVALKMADAYIGQGAYSQSAAWYKNAIRRGHKSTDVQLRYADALRAKQILENLDELYEELSAKDAGNPKLLNGLQSLKMIRQW